MDSINSINSTTTLKWRACAHSTKNENICQGEKLISKKIFGIKSWTCFNLDQIGGKIIPVLRMLKRGGRNTANNEDL